jgi:hypothetical protein
MSKRNSGPPRRPRDPAAKAVRAPRLKPRGTSNKRGKAPSKVKQETPPTRRAALRDATATLWKLAKQTTFCLPTLY